MLPAGGVGPVGALSAGAGICSTSESEPSGGGPLPRFRSPSALMTSCASSNAGDRGRALHGAVGSAIAVLLVPEADMRCEPAVVLRCAPALPMWAVFPPLWSVPGGAQVPVAVLPRPPLCWALVPPASRRANMCYGAVMRDAWAKHRHPAGTRHSGEPALWGWRGGVPWGVPRTFLRGVRG